MGNDLKRWNQDRQVRYVNDFINKKVRIQKTPEYVFLTAAKDNNVVKMRKLIGGGVSVNCAVFHEDEVKTPLHVAAKWGHVEAVRLLLENGCDVDIAPSDLRAPALLLACSSQSADIGIVRLLLEAGASVNQTTKFGHTSLLAASAGGNLDIVCLLLENGADIDHMSYAEHDQVGSLDAKLSERTENPLFGNTALMHACLDHRFSCVRELVARGCNLGLQNNYGNTALHIACFSRRHHRPHRPVVAGHPRIVKELIDHGAKLNIINIYGETPLNRALDGACILADMYLPHAIEISLMQDFLNIAQSLIRGGCDTMIWDNRGQSALTHILRLNFILANRKQDALVQETARQLRSVVHKLHMTGCRPDVIHTFTNPTLDLQIHVDTVDWLLRQQGKTFSLKQSCRICLRRALPQPFVLSVETSLLPLQLKSYLLMDDLT